MKTRSVVPNVNMWALETSRLRDCSLLKEGNKIKRTYSAVVIAESRNDLARCITGSEDSDFALDIIVRPQVNMLRPTVITHLSCRPKCVASTGSERI
jgi:hypothetical protein